MGRTVYMHRRLQSLSPKYNTMSPRERAVALGMGQLGEGNVSSYINTGTLPRDSAGVPITKWGTAVGKRFDGASSIPSKPQPGQQAPPAPVLPQTSIKPGQQAPQTPTKPGQPAPQVSLVNVGSGTPQASPSRPSSTTTPPSPTGGNGPTAPFLPSYNPDNFLTLYSRMVYNIVG